MQDEALKIKKRRYESKGGYEDVGDGCSRGTSKQRQQICSVKNVCGDDNGDIAEEINTENMVVDPIFEERINHDPPDNPSINPLSKMRLEIKNFSLTGKRRKDLIKLCRKEGIDDTGSDQVLKDRIKRFADYWKSECDREVHRASETVLKNFNCQEAERAVSEL